MNSPGIKLPGQYEYRWLSPESWARRLMEGSEWISRIGSTETQAHICELTGIEIPLSREAALMIPGDLALVIRLRISDPAARGTVRPAAWEYGLLTMLT